MDSLIQLLRELSSVWPIATPVVELLQTATSNDRFSEVMKKARSKLQQQANSDTILVAEQPRHAPFRRPTPKHIFLPRSRMAVRSMVSGVLNHTVCKERKTNPAEDEAQSIEPDSRGRTEAQYSNQFGLQCDPGDIVQVLHQYVRLGQSLENGIDS
jgi:hypothetical protein